jgi:hypothetical protein
MLFVKKKKMIDVRELQRRGVVRIPKQDIVVPTDREGFVEFGSNAQSIQTTQTSEETSPTPNVMDFLGSSSAAAVPSSSNHAESERITELDNKIYKLEQRIELLEKKLDVNQPSEQNLGVMGW